MPGPRWSGYSWELFDEFVFPTARDSFGLNYTTYRIVPFESNAQMLQAVSLGLVDAGHAAITKTAARSEVLKFSTGWFDTGLAVAARAVSGVPVGDALGSAGSVAGVVLNGLILLATAILSMAVALFILERAAPGPRPVMRRGCISGVCDSASLITQILAGGNVRMPSGRLSGPVTTVCSVSSTIMTIIFTALTTVALQSAAQLVAVTGFSDLSGKTVIMPRSTTAEAYVRENGVGVKLLGADSLDDALSRFSAGAGDAMVYDKPILTSFVARDRVASGSSRFAVVGSVFERQQYGIAFDKALPDSEINAINKAILAVYGSDEVARLRQTWLGQDVPAAATSTSDSSVTDFLSNNFWSIAFMVGIVVGTAMVVGLVAFIARTVASMLRQGDCTLAGAYRWSAGVCSGAQGSGSGVKRNRKALASLSDAVQVAQSGRRRRMAWCGPCRGCRRGRAVTSRVASGGFQDLEAAQGTGGRDAEHSIGRAAPASKGGSPAARPLSAGSGSAFLVDGTERRLATHLPAPSRRRLLRPSSRPQNLPTRHAAPGGEPRANAPVVMESLSEGGQSEDTSADAATPGPAARAGWARDCGVAAQGPVTAWSEPKSVAESGGDGTPVKRPSKEGPGEDWTGLARPSAHGRTPSRPSARGDLRQGHSFSGSYKVSALVGKAAATAAAQSVGFASGANGAPSPMAGPGGSLAPSPAAATPVHAGSAPGGDFAVAGGTLSTEERLFLKHEQWAFRLTASVAPVLPPSDLLWLIWERVDKLTQQALLQRAMGRLDVPADLEEVSPEDVEAEAKLLAEELEARGVDPKVARRAALAAAMVGATDEDEMQASLSSEKVQSGLKRAAEAARERLEEQAQRSRGAGSSAPEGIVAARLAGSPKRGRTNGAGSTSRPSSKPLSAPTGQKL